MSLRGISKAEGYVATVAVPLMWNINWKALEKTIGVHITETFLLHFEWYLHSQQKLVQQEGYDSFELVIAFPKEQ